MAQNVLMQRHTKWSIQPNGKEKREELKEEVEGLRSALRQLEGIEQLPRQSQEVMDKIEQLQIDNSRLEARNKELQNENIQIKTELEEAQKKHWRMFPGDTLEQKRQGHLFQCAWNGMEMSMECNLICWNGRFTYQQKEFWLPLLVFHRDSIGWPSASPPT